jgi:hypothetical protein
MPADAIPLMPSMEKTMTAAQLQSSLDAQLLKAIDELSKGISKG